MDTDLSEDTRGHCQWLWREICSKHGADMDVTVHSMEGDILHFNRFVTMSPEMLSGLSLITPFAEPLWLYSVLF